MGKFRELLDRLQGRGAGDGYNEPPTRRRAALPAVPSSRGVWLMRGICKLLILFDIAAGALFFNGWSAFSAVLIGYVVASLLVMGHYLWVTR